MVFIFIYTLSLDFLILALSIFYVNKNFIINKNRTKT